MRFHFMRLKCIRVLPDGDNGEMVGARGLLEHVIPDVARVIPAFPGQTPEQNLSFVLAGRRDVNMRNDAECAGSRLALRASCKGLMHSLITRAAMNCIEPCSELYRLFRFFMGVEG